MINRLIALANYLDESGFKKEADRVNALIKDNAPLFVYGTLRKGEKNHKMLEGAKSLGELALRSFRRVDGDGPAIIPGDKNDSVDGELYDVDLKILKEIDEYEGEEYIRELVELEDGSKAYAYVYFPIEKIKVGDVHDAADAAKIKWDDNEEFMNRTEKLVGEKHLDDMTKEELHTIIRAIKTESF
tara:strand:+ start:11964 stop:12521 length:558 start_codon:yes stop_codon:yes gene_type:complete